MSEFKGTKGEWDVYVDNDNFCIKNEKLEAICIISSKAMDNEESANAKLISYAPELLEMVKTLQFELTENIKDLHLKGFPEADFQTCYEAHELIKKVTS